MFSCQETGGLIRILWPWPYEILPFFLPSPPQHIKSIFGSLHYNRTFAWAVSEVVLNPSASFQNWECVPNQMHTTVLQVEGIGLRKVQRGRRTGWTEAEASSDNPKKCLDYKREWILCNLKGKDLIFENVWHEWIFSESSFLPAVTLGTKLEKDQDGFPLEPDPLCGLECPEYTLPCSPFYCKGVFGPNTI